jgi:precorrin-8X/cobalt-precorrin-8 methylmutase
VAARIVHACGMPDAIADLAFSRGACVAGRAALQQGATILCDVRMVAAGLLARRLERPTRARRARRARRGGLAAKSGQTRTAAGMELARRLKMRSS